MKAEIEIEISAKIESLFVSMKLKINKTVYRITLCLSPPQN